MLNTNDIRFFYKAYKAAELSDWEKTKVGCIAVYKGRIIGIGCNTKRTHPMQEKYNKYRGSTNKNYFYPSLHAEINCLNSIRHMDINFSKVKLYIYRICIERDHGLSRPCPSCMAAIRDLGIKNIYYTTNIGLTHENIGDLQCNGGVM